MSSLEMVVGEIEEVEGHYVATMFLSIGVPLVPTHSMYVHTTDIARGPGGTSIRYEGRRLPIVWTSVILGYARVWLGFLTFGMPFLLMWGQTFSFSIERPEWQITIATLVIWIASFFPGRIRGEHKTQLLWLGRATGAYYDPRHDDRLGRMGVCAVLEPSLRALGTEPDVESMRRAIVKADAKLLGKIYAYGRYAELDSPEYRAVTNEAWSRISRL